MTGMNIGKEVYQVHRSLSKVNGKFLEFVENNPAALKSSNFSLLDLKDELYALHPWPNFVNVAVGNFLLTYSHVSEFDDVPVKYTVVSRTESYTMRPRRVLGGEVAGLS